MNQSSQSKAWTFALFSCITFFYFFNNNLPFFEPYNSVTRQSIVAAIAQNFYHSGFNFFNPEINENGAGPYLFNGEMPIFAYTMSLIYFIIGGVQEWVGRSMSSLCALASCILLFVWAKSRYGVGAARVTAAIFAFAPLSMALSRSIQPEAAMNFFTIATLYYFDRYAKTSKVMLLFVSAIFMFLVIATKVTNLYLFIPLAFLAFQKDGVQTFLKYKYYIFIAFSCLALIWYARMVYLAGAMELAYEPYNLSIKFESGQDTGFFAVYLSPQNWFNVLKIFSVHLLTPIGVIMLLMGLGRKWQGLDLGILIWFLAALFQVFVLWKGVLQHPYYQYPLMAPAALIVGRGWAWISADTGYVKQMWFKACVAVLLAASLCMTAHFYKGLYFMPPYLNNIITAGQKIQELTSKDALIIANHGQSPIQLYYCNRKGWGMGTVGYDQEELIARIKELVSKGAKYFVTSDMHAFRKTIVFKDYMQQNHKIVIAEDNYIIFILQ